MALFATMTNTQVPDYIDLAEAVRFELTNGFPLPVFKTGAIDHSATLPRAGILTWLGPTLKLNFYLKQHEIS